jgi:hypothetical protein
MKGPAPQLQRQEAHAMQMLYNSDSFVVVQFLSDTQTGADSIQPRGYEIVDKLAGKEIYLHGPVAESFQRGVEALVQQGPREEDLDAFIAGFTVLAQQPVLLH